MAALGVQAQLPGRTEPVVARSLRSAEGIRWMLTHTIDNFITFAPVGTVLVVMLGIGVAEHSGLFKVCWSGWFWPRRGCCSPGWSCWQASFLTWRWMPVMWC